MARTSISSSRRKHGAFHYVRSILGQVWRHPSNRQRRMRAISRSCAWQIYKRVTGRPLLVKFGSYSIKCYPDSGSAGNVIYFTERFDPTEMSFLEHYLREGDRVVDVGANVGLYSLWMSHCMRGSGLVHAYEAAPKSLTRLRENIALNQLEDTIVVRPFAVSDAPGTVEFFIDFDVSNGIVAPGGGSDRSRSVKVEAVALDQELGGAPLALAKIDVEGAELRVLRGWERSLAGQNPPVMLIEALDGQLRRHGNSVADLLDWLGARGYSIFTFDVRTQRLVPLAARPGNVIAIADSNMAMVQERIASRSAAVANHGGSTQR